MYRIITPFLLVLFSSGLLIAQNPVSYVNPFIGTSNYGATYPGPIAPRGMVSISPFNIAGPLNLPMEKDSRWLSNPYVNENTFLTGFSHVNLSGVGCPDLGVLLLMPTTGPLETNHLKYGSSYSNETAKAGYYSTHLNKYNIKVEATASTRVGISKYSFPIGKANILLNLGLGLTNEQGASIKIVSPTEIEGTRTVGAFCYHKPEEAYPVYFVVKFNKPAHSYGIWKTPSITQGTESQWMKYQGKTRIKEGYKKEVIGDSIGSYFTYHFEKPTQIEVKVGISYVSIENARENLEKESKNISFEAIYESTSSQWNKLLSKIKVEGGTPNDKTIFYTALYHTLIHPNTLNDYNGEYPKMQTRETLKAEHTRFTVFSLWDTYRNLHALMSLVYPQQQSNMIKSMLNIYDESGWLPKWELNATETTTMVGDPAGIIITDTYLKGIQDFDIEKGYEAMLKSADQLTNNPLRPHLEDYIEKGYITTANRGSVSKTQEYNISDFAISELANKLNKKEDYKRFKNRSISYRKLFDKDLKLLRPRNNDGTWYEPFNPEAGANFSKNVGYVEGNAWQYAFMNPHDMEGLIKLMGGQQDFSNQLQKVFDTNQFDMANEPDIAYPFLFNYVKGEEWRSQKLVKDLIAKHFQNTPKGLPGNDDTGTMSAWLVFSMMGIYPLTPGVPTYTITTPIFDRITIELDPNYYKKKTLVIERIGNDSEKIKHIKLNGKKHQSYFIDHLKLLNGQVLQIISK